MIKKDIFEGYYQNNTILAGNSKDFNIDKHDSEIKVDIIVKEKKSIRIWGQIKDCKNHSVEDALVKLIKIEHNCLKGIAHTISDCNGFYQFDLKEHNPHVCYQIIVGKAATGYERVIPVCDEECYHGFEDGKDKHDEKDKDCCKK